MRFTRPGVSLIAICSLFCSCGVSAQRQGVPQHQTTNTSQSKEPQAKESPATAPTRAAIDPNKFAIIIAGAGGEPAYTKKFTAQAEELYSALTNRLGFDEKKVFLLMEHGAGGPENGGRENVARATSDETRKAFEAVKRSASVESFILVTLIGHGSFDNQQAKFNLLGPDLTAKDYATLLSSLPSRNVVFINCASSSGEFVKPLSGANRIVITATRSGNEQNATVFCEHFIAGLSDGAADTDKNGRLSVFEAFNYATRMTADWYKQKDRLATEHALLDDNGDGVGHEEAKEGDGAIAKTTYLDSKTVEQAGADAAIARLLEERQRIEQEIEKLKSRKDQMKQEEYEEQLERLLVDLAKVSQEIKSRQKK
ncbi:MAG TPA: hypothetical protein VFQ92_19910 [Blastocatellia bacterium]|nr:hypothetical protein [Blastocatellia bacterium]